MRTAHTVGLALVIAAMAASAPAHAAEIVELNAQTWDEYAPQGKEVDCIYGDFALRNDRIVAVVANPIPGRNANLTIREIGGSILDLTHRDQPNDQLSAFNPGAQLRPWVFDGIEIEDNTATLRLVAEPKAGELDIQLNYTIQDGWPYVLVETVYSNPSDAPMATELVDTLRADRTFDKAPDATSRFFWVYDKWFGQAYGFATEEDHEILTATSGNTSTLRYLADGKARVTLQPGESHRLRRKVFSGVDRLEVRGIADQLAGTPLRTVSLVVNDEGGHAVAEADIEVQHNGETHATGRTNADGRRAFELPQSVESWTVAISAPAYGSKEITIDADAESHTITLPEPGYVVAQIHDEEGETTPCKVQFQGKNGTEDPDFGPDSGEFAVGNLCYTANGQFRQVIPPGEYDVIISRGPEFDAVFTEIKVERGQETNLEAELKRTVQTPGWISAEFHSHSSPSGDNTASQLGRVLNLLAEHLEFAPCTEHNRIDSYDPHLDTLDAHRFMATCTGIELTGSPLPLNHQNAFPLEHRPRTQDGGAPLIDPSPEVQIERLAFWDDKSEKLVQVNHPDLGWMFFDRDGDGQPDGGFSGMVGFMDAIEVHPPHFIFEDPTIRRNDLIYNNTIFNWLQLLNQGYRIPGVVNTDAHYNFHGSGWLRNYILCPTDDPAEIDTLDIVRATQNGHVIMTNGPYLEVTLRAGEAEAIPGGELDAPDGKATLQVRVQCPNWFDVDRVQVFLNGRPEESLNFTRERSADLFSDEVVKFEREIPIELDGDTHVIVATIGENSALGPVMGPDRGSALPVAVANPIFVDVDGGGFQPNGDTLGAPLPVKGGQPAP